MVKGTVRVTVETDLDEEALDNKKKLAYWAEYEVPVDVELTEQHMQLPLVARGKSAGTETEAGNLTS